MQWARSNGSNKSLNLDFPFAIAIKCPWYTHLWSEDTEKSHKKQEPMAHTETNGGKLMHLLYIYKLRFAGIKWIESRSADQDAYNWLTLYIIIRKPFNSTTTVFLLTPLHTCTCWFFLNLKVQTALKTCFKQLHVIHVLLVHFREFALNTCKPAW